MGAGSLRGVQWTIAVWWGDPSKAREASRRFGGDAAEAGLACMDRYLARLNAGGPARGLPAGCEGVFPADWRIRMLSREGDVDGAYAEFEKPRPRGRPMALDFLYYPEMKAFRDDPRFMPVAHRLGLSDYWLKSHRWPDFCSDPDLPYDCKAEARKLAAVG